MVGAIFHSYGSICPYYILSPVIFFAPFVLLAGTLSLAFASLIVSWSGRHRRMTYNILPETKPRQMQMLREGACNVYLESTGDAAGEWATPPIFPFAWIRL